jgi:hypothetical protein
MAAAKSGTTNHSVPGQSLQQLRAVAKQPNAAARVAANRPIESATLRIDAGPRPVIRDIPSQFGSDSITQPIKTESRLIIKQTRAYSSPAVIRNARCFAVSWAGKGLRFGTLTN